MAKKKKKKSSLAIEKWKYEMAKRKANDYKIHIAESIKTKEELIDKLKAEEEELIKTIKITTAEKVKAIKSEIDVLKVRKNRQ